MEVFDFEKMKTWLLEIEATGTKIDDFRSLLEKTEQYKHVFEIIVVDMQDNGLWEITQSWKEGQVWYEQDGII